MEKKADILEAKRILRKQVQAELERMAPEARAAASAQARAILTAQPLWQQAQSVLFFAPLPEELDVWPLLAEALSAGKAEGDEEDREGGCGRDDDREHGTHRPRPR